MLLHRVRHSGSHQGVLVGDADADDIGLLFHLATYLLVHRLDDGVLLLGQHKGIDHRKLFFLLAAENTKYSLHGTAPPRHALMVAQVFIIGAVVVTV